MSKFLFAISSILFVSQINFGMMGRIGLTNGQKCENISTPYVNNESIPLKYRISRNATQMLKISNAYPEETGTWGEAAFCPNETFANAIEIKYETPGKIDETLVNGVKLYCRSKFGTDVTYVTSSVSSYGNWYNMRACPTDLMTGFRAQVLSYQGLLIDDVAVQDVQIDCGYGKYIVDGLSRDVERPQRQGCWSSFATCREGSAVCGIETRIESRSLGDEVGLADFVLFCCQINNTRSLPQ